VVALGLDGSFFQSLFEGRSLVYSHLAAGDHRLVISNHCAGSVRVQHVNVVVGDTVTVPVGMPADCM